jgi:hypothetical protein
MPTLPRALATVIGAFAPVFSRRVFEHATLLIVGAILAPGKRIITSVVRVMGRSDDEQFQNYHRGLNRPRWWPLDASHRLLGLLLDAFMPEGPVVMGIDETIERRRGEKIAAKGSYRDPEGRFEPQALLATNLQLTPLQSLTSFVRHWQMEATFEEARAHLGGATQRQWGEKATARTTPTLLALYSLVTLLAAHLIGTHPMPVRTAAWYRKAHAIFADTIALEANGCGVKAIFQHPRPKPRW